MSEVAADDPFARLRSLVDGLERMAAESDRELAADAEERARAAREGRLGPDWQEVQQRLDRGETTLAAVFSGEDTSAAAGRLRAQARRTVDRWAGELAVPPEVEAARRDADAEWLRLHRRPTGR